MMWVCFLLCVGLLMLLEMGRWLGEGGEDEEEEEEEEEGEGVLVL